MTNAPTPAGLPPQPDPSQDRQPSDSPRIPGIGRVLSLVRRMVRAGQDLAASVCRRAQTPEFADFALRYGTADPDAIVARIRRGLMLALALTARLADLAARGKDLKPAPLPALPGGTPRQPRPAAPSKPPKPRPVNLIDTPLDRQPSMEAIEAEVRRRQPGAILVDICCEMALVPELLEPGDWTLLHNAIVAYGGSLAAWTVQEVRRMFAEPPGAARARDSAAAAAAAPAVAPQAGAAPAGAAPPAAAGPGKRAGTDAPVAAHFPAATGPPCDLVLFSAAA